METEGPVASIKQLRRKRRKAIRRRKVLYRQLQLTKNAERKRSLVQRLRSRKAQVNRLARLIKLRRRGVPSWLPDTYVPLWRSPWTAKARSNQGFRDLLWSKGYASPNFTEAETRCKRGDRVPAPLRKGCQNQAFQLEQVRRELGDPSMPVLSWFRPADYNRAIGGATNSRHIQADATDFDVATVNRIGRDRFDAAFEKFYRNDGYGQYPSGSRHGDVRGYRARWTSY